MVIPEDQDGKGEECLSLAVQADTDAEASTRKGGLPIQPEVPNTVIVDMREFRSELPGILYKRGMKTEPVTLQVRLKILHLQYRSNVHLFYSIPIYCVFLFDS